MLEVAGAHEPDEHLGEHVVHRRTVRVAVVLPEQRETRQLRVAARIRGDDPSLLSRGAQAALVLEEPVVELPTAQALAEGELRLDVAGARQLDGR